MTTSYEHFKSIGMKEVPLSQLPSNYGWVTGCGDGRGGYYNFFMDMSKEVECFNKHGQMTDEYYKKYGLMCRIK